MESLINTVKEYFNDTTVHGFRYVVNGRNRCEKIFWVILIVIGFIFSGIIINNSIWSWRNIPLQTTIEKVSKPIQHFPFPAVTICNHDQLEMPRRNRWMFAEQVLNWIDISSVNSNGTLSQAARKAEKDFQLNALRRKLGDKFENHFYRTFEKSCFLRKKRRDYFQTCGQILEYIVLEEEKNVSQIRDMLYEETLKRWDEKYPECDRKSTYGYDVMEKDLFPIYEKLLRDKHEMLKLNISNEKIGILSKCNVFKKRYKCENAVKEIELLWRRLENRIRYTSICNFGTLVSNANFLLEEWRYFKEAKKNMEITSSNESKMLHQAISETMKNLYPNLFVDNLAFFDMLGLLGYSTDTDFASFDNLFYKSLDYEATASTLRPLFSFSMKTGQFQGLQGNHDTSKLCNLQSLYKEWTNYMYYRQDKVKIKSKTNDVGNVYLW